MYTHVIKIPIYYLTLSRAYSIIERTRCGQAFLDKKIKMTNRMNVRYSSCSYVSFVAEKKFF